MKYEISLSTEAKKTLKAIPKHASVEVIKRIHRILSHQAEQVSSSGIKRLRGTKSPQYRLRVSSWRVFYDVSGEGVVVIEIQEKAAAKTWLSENAEWIEQERQKDGIQENDSKGSEE